MIALLIILYIIIAILVIMGYIFYQTRINHEKVNIDGEDGCIFINGIFWPLSAVVFTFWLICHLIYIFFDWFARSLEDKEDTDGKPD